MSPFDSARYTALLEGLEATTVRASALERTSRLDAEYFQSWFRRSEELLARLNTRNVAQLVAVSDGNHFSISDDFVEDGIPYYRGQDVTGRFFVDSASPNFITEVAFNRQYMKRSHLKKGDVLLSIVGTIGELSLVDSEKDATCSCKLAIFRPHSIEPEFLAAFLRCAHGNNQIKRLKRGAVQQGFLLEDVDQLLIPEFSANFRTAVVAAVQGAREAQAEAQDGTREAEIALLTALGLADWAPPEPLTYTARSSDIVAAGRNDAQYFRPKYDALVEFMANRQELMTLDGAVTKGRSVSYSEDGIVKIIRSGDLSDLDLEENFLRSDPSEPIAYLQRGDVLISSIGFGSIGKVQVFDKAGKYGTVSEVTIVRQNILNPYYLAAFLSSAAGQLQIDRFITGATGQLHLYPRDVQKIYVPVASKPIQNDVESIVQAAFAARARSRALLAAAKRAIEIAIEDGESIALAFLDEQTSEGAN